jgi:hypothetical protein
MRLGVAALICSLSLLASCSGGPTDVINQAGANQSIAGAGMTGSVYGGRQPIVGASVYLYAANTTGYGNASISLLTSAANTTKDGSGNYYVTTDSGGNFSISGDYTCPSTASQVYIYSVGGNPGSGTNSGAALVAAVGTCPASGTLSSSLYIVVNEVSTVAASWALSGTYVTDWRDVSSSGTALAQTGIANAFATAANLETLSTGQALATTPAGNGTVPQSEINTLANILAACVNSTGPSSTACTTLFTNAVIGGVAATDTAQASIAISRNPQAHIAAYFALQVAGAPFQPSLSAAPNDFTIAINYTGGGLSAPAGIAIDGSGKVWVSNITALSISEFGSNGAALSPSTGFTGGGLSGGIVNEVIPGIALDTVGDVWVANPSSSLSEFNSNGTPISGSAGYTGGGLNIPDFLAVDALNHIWTGNRGNYSISEFSAGGVAISGSSGFTGGGLNSPSGIAIDTSGNVWAANNGVNGGATGGNSLSELTSAAIPISPATTGYTGGGLLNPFALAIDAQGNVWVGDTPTGGLSEFSSSGTAISGSSGFTGGGLNGVGGIAIDGLGDVFVANIGGNSISKFSSNGTAVSNSSGWQGGGLSSPVGVAIDGAGNVWVTNAGNNSITQFVGLARNAVVTPIVANLLAPYGAHAVNRP